MRQRHANLAAVVLVLVGFALGLATAPAMAAQGSFERSLTVTGAVDLEVTTGSGNIKVGRGASGSVRVVGHIQVSHSFGGMSPEEKVKALESNPPIQQSGNSIRIGQISDERLRNGVSISYEIWTPAETRVRSQSGSGDESFQDISGPVRATTGSGNMEVASVTGEVSAHTGSGAIRAASLSGRFVGNTGSGNINVERSELTEMKVETGSGNVTVRQVKGAVSAETGSGSIDVEGSPTAMWRLQAGSGGVRLHLPADAAFELHAKTGSGDIHTGHPITMSGSMRRGEMRGTVRGGGALLDVSTGSGNIEID